MSAPDQSHPPTHAALRAIVTALRHAARTDPALRAELAEFLRELLDAGTTSGITPTAIANPTPERGPATPPIVVAEPRPIRGPRVIQELKLGDSVAEIVRYGDTLERVTPIDTPRPSPDEPPAITVPHPARDAVRVDLDKVEQRARLKHAACLRAAAGEPTADLLDQLRALRPADEYDPGLWMCAPLAPEGRARAAQAAPCYAALAAAVALARFLEANEQLRPENGLEDAFGMIAQAQSAIRNFVDESRNESDADQFALFRWLRHQTGESCCRVLIHRHMRRDDIAPPGEGERVAVALARELDAWKQRIELPRRIRKLTNKIKYERGQADRTADPAEQTTHWRTIDGVVTELRDLGVRTRDIGAHLVDAPPPGGFEPAPALAEVLAYLQRRDERPAPEEDRRTWSDEVPRARDLLAGSRLLVLCGNPNAHMRDAYIEAFGLEACEWPEIKDHKFPIARVEGAIRARTHDLVLLASGYTNHHHAEVADVCRDAGVRLIRLPADRGYAVNQVAHAALEQLGPREARA